MRRSYRDDERVVNYRDAVLYGRDLKILEEEQDEGFEASASASSQRWLNDELVHFQLLRLLASAADRPNNKKKAATRGLENEQEVPTHPAVEEESGPVSSSCDGPLGPALLGMDPSVLSFMMNLAEDNADDGDEEWEEELQSIAASHNYFKGVRVCFLPVNDGMGHRRSESIAVGPTPAPGTHWSLVVAVVVTSAAATAAATTSAGDDEEDVVGPQARDSREYLIAYYLHFDSVPGHNSVVARDVAAHWDHLWRTTASRANDKEEEVKTVPHCKRIRGRGGTHHGAGSVPARECRAPMQSNGYDCGLHVLGSVEALVDATPDKACHARTENELPSLVHDWERALARHFGNDPAHVCSLLRQRMANDIRSLGSARIDPGDK